MKTHAKRMGALLALGFSTMLAGQSLALAQEQGDMTWGPGEIICQTGAANPDNGEEWGRTCFADGWGYGSVYVTSDGDHHDFHVHVTDHFTCTDDSETECEIYTGGTFETRTFREGNFEYSEDGFLPMFILTCKCQQ